MPSIFVRTMRWLATAMITFGLCMMAVRRYVRNRIQKADEEGTVAARRMLQETEPSRPTLPPATPAPRRIQWTPDRVASLDDEGYAHLCAGYWETRGYAALLQRPDGMPGRLIELRRLPDRKVLAGLVRVLPRDDGRSGVEGVRGLGDARHRSDVAMAVIMVRGSMSPEARTLAGQHALQAMDDSALLDQLRMLSQDQQEALFAELEAYLPSAPGVSMESTTT